IVAVNEPSVSGYIRVLAKQKKLLVNVADNPDLCDFYLGSIVQKGNLKIAISTNGKSPTTAKRIKELLNHHLPEQIDDSIENLYALRKQLNGSFEDKVNKLNEITSVLVEQPKLRREDKWKRI